MRARHSVVFPSSTASMRMRRTSRGAQSFDLHLDERGSITAVMHGKPVSSPASAAEEVIRPLLINAFGA